VSDQEAAAIDEEKLAGGIAVKHQVDIGFGGFYRRSFGLA
jgi:hypothetical protein